MQVYFTVSVGRKFSDSNWCPLNREGVRLIWGPLKVSLYHSEEVIRANNVSRVGSEYVQHVKS